MDGVSPIVTARSTAANSTTSTSRAYRSHSEAERRRRQRINGHLTTLRSLIPSASKLDKANLLGEVVRHVRELHGMMPHDDDVALLLPAESDEVHVEEQGGARLRAWVSCSDRPGLLAELNQAVGSVHARAVRAEICTVGGRTRSALELEAAGAETLGTEEGRKALFVALRSVLAANGHGSVDNYKRQRR